MLSFALQVVPFEKLPDVCANQLRGADPEHWEALLAYLEAVASGPACPHPLQGMRDLRPVPRNTAKGCAKSDPKYKHLKIRATRKAGERMSGAAVVKTATNAIAMARERSPPTLGILRTAKEGGYGCGWKCQGGGGE